MNNIPNDYLDMVDALNARQVEFILVGAYAVAFHGYPRDSHDFDILIRPAPENILKANAALKDFGSPFVITHEDIKTKKLMQLGVKPVRIDLLSVVSGVTTDDIWEKCVKGQIAGRDVFFISYDHLIKNKRAAGRDKDLLDVHHLENAKRVEQERLTKQKNIDGAS